VCREFTSAQVADSIPVWLFDNNAFAWFSLNQDGCARGIARNNDSVHNL